MDELHSIGLHCIELHCIALDCIGLHWSGTKKGGRGRKGGGFSAAPHPAVEKDVGRSVHVSSSQGPGRARRVQGKA